MILKKVVLKNFRGYYGENTFDFSDGLTLILGDNGDGKTTFYDALDWLFETTVDNKDEGNISKKRVSELSVGESDEQSVSVEFLHKNERYNVEKRFTFTMQDTGKVKIANYSFVAKDLTSPEKYNIPGKEIIDRYFDNKIRKYCFFAGENELNIFENETALKTLVEEFSEISKFENYLDICSYLEKKSNTTYKNELKLGTKAKGKTKTLTDDLTRIENELADKEALLKKKQVMSQDYSQKLKALESNKNLTEQYNMLKERIEAKRKKIATNTSRANINYNVELFDNGWILCHFPNIIEEYTKKVYNLRREREKQQRAYNRKQGEVDAKKKMYSEQQKALSEYTPLPWFTPDDSYMVEMIEDEVCKVCGRPALKGSDAYNFMLKRLEEYREHVKQQQILINKEEEEVKKEELFENKYIHELHNLDVSVGGQRAEYVANLLCNINDTLDFVKERQKDVESLKVEVSKLEEEKNRVLIDARDKNLSESDIIKNIDDLTGFFNQHNRTKDEIRDLELEVDRLKRQKENYEKELKKLVPMGSSIELYEKIHSVMGRINKAFIDARDKNLFDFIDDMNSVANKYLSRLNEGDFHGKLQIYRDPATGNAYGKLYSTDGTEIINPNGALKTTMYMSILFAISDLTQKKRDEDYPLVFDAPTSSFGEAKETDFYNVIDGINKQCVIVTKDLLRENPMNRKVEVEYDVVNRLNCSVYRIEKAEGFDENDLSTIQIEIKKIKDGKK